MINSGNRVVSYLNGKHMPALHRMQGSAAIEYLVAASALVLVFFSGSPSLVDVVLQAIRIAYARFVFSMGLP